MNFILESCVETRAEIDSAARGGAARIELCSRLDIGGLTPAVAMVRYARSQGLPTAAMIRRRAGFFAARADIPALKADIRQMAAAGVSGLVFGYLCGPAQSPRLDIPTLAALVKEAGRCAGRFGTKELVFHMAFDELPEAAQFPAIDTLAAFGFTRILTKGGRTGPAEANIDRLKALAGYARGKLTILCGGSVTDDNYLKIAAAGLTEFHGRRLACSPAGKGVLL